MKKLLTLGLAVLSAGLVHAADLRFTAGSIYNTNQVSLTVSGPTGTNLVCTLERLNLTNQTWDVVSTYTLTNGGPYGLTSSLFSGTYGFFRTHATNNSYYSTNAFGAIAGSVGTGKSMLGNPFGNDTLTNILPNPPDGTTVYQWNNGANGWDSSSYFGGWDTNFTIHELEGFFLENGDTNAMRFQFSGLFTTNAVSKSIPTNLSLLTSPLYLLLNTTTWQNDSLTNGLVSGNAGLPVQSSGFSPQSSIDKWVAATNGYAHYILNSTNNWTLNGTNAAVKLYLGEGFFLNKPTNATWNVSRPIW